MNPRHTSARARHAAAVACAAVTLLLAAPTAAHAQTADNEAQVYAGGGLNTTFAGPSPTPGRQVTGSGTFIVEPTVNSNDAMVTFQCSVVATPDAVSTFVRPPDKDGCQLFKGEALIAEADGIALIGPTAATNKRATVDLALPGAFEICWRVGAVFRDGTVLTNERCTTGGAEPAVSGHVTAHAVPAAAPAPQSSSVVAFTCAALATPHPLYTHVASCQLYHAGVLLAEAPPSVKTPGALAVTGAAKTVSLDNPRLGQLTVCWTAAARFLTAATKQISDCSGLTVA